MTRIKCPKCEHVNPEGVTTCVRCNAPLPRVRVDAPGPMGNPSDPSNPMNQIQFRSGQIIASRYTVLHMIGRGGMGCIYRVRDNALKEEVALKMLLPQFVRDKMVVERFFNEAKIARSLSHPNIVRVHDIGMTGNIIYISMELIRGRSLRNILEELGAGQRMPIREALRVVDDLCAALEYAHHRTVHRDIKPENVMVCEDGSVKLMDFGISKLMESTRLTAQSMIMGTPFYMSPEQLKNSADVDARSDVYSVGVMLYEILTGNMPTGVPKPASQLTREVPPTLDPIVAKCVDPDPDKRYQSAAELRAALRQIRAMLGDVSVPASSAGDMLQAVPAEKLQGNRNTLRVAGIALVMCIVGAAGAGLYGLESLRRSAEAVTAANRSSEATTSPNGSDGPFDSTVFQKIKSTVDRVRTRAMTEAERHPEMSRVIDDADLRWKQVELEASRENPQALDLARQALQCYLAPVIWPAGMVFVPPGEVSLGDMPGADTVIVDGFFIDMTEVTNGQFEQFCESEGWRQRYALQSVPREMPVSHTTFYDAEAFAAWAKKKLPTEVQWARAAYGERSASPAYPWGNDWQDGLCNSAGGVDGYEGLAPVGSFENDVTWAGCYDMAGNVSEWTRTQSAQLPYNPNDGREDLSKLFFGTQVVVRGGNFLDTGRTRLSARFASLFEASQPTIGFRCVVELPSRLEDIEALL